MNFVHLNAHSNYSLLSGAITVERLPRLAKNAGMKALALTDTNGTYGLIPFLKACKEEGIHPVAGAEIETSDGNLAVVMARNRAGLGVLNQLISARHLDKAFDLSSALQALPENDVFIMTSCPGLLDALGPKPHVFAELSLGQPREAIRSLIHLARRQGLKTVATGRVHFENRGDWGTHRLLSAIRTSTTIGNLPLGSFVPEACSFRSEAEMRRLFAEIPEALDRAGDLAAACFLDLELGKVKPSRFPVEKGQDPFQLLVEEARRGLRNRLKPPDPAGWEKLHKELDVIRTTGMTDTFLVCWELVRWARNQGIPSVGRGSAANSLVAFSLGITHVNPLKHNLFFERFLNPARATPADLDIDFGTEEREEIFKHIFKFHGEGRASMVGALAHLQARGALRETAKALGIPESEVGPTLKRIPHHVLLKDMKTALEAWPDLKGLPLDQEPFKSLIEAARNLDGFPRHVMTHPCGVVVAPGAITDFCPLQRGDKGYVVTQWDMYSLEAAGLIKIDILGQKGLAVILDVRQGLSPGGLTPGHPKVSVPKGDYPDFPDYDPFVHDPATQLAMAQGRTIGCYYVESPVMIQMLRQGRCRDFETLTALSSIIRPGVSNYGGKKEYLHRLLGLDPVSYLDPRLEPILKDSLGCLIYQEQVVRIAADLGGMSLAEADMLRRAMEWKKRGPTDLRQAKAKFLSEAGKKGVREAEEIWRRLESFAGYAFCKAHSASFALESFESLYFKVHHPALFMAAVLSNQGGFYDASEYVEECRRLGLTVLLPHINHSTWPYKPSPSGPRPEPVEGRGEPAPERGRWKADSASGGEGGLPGSVRVGLMAIHGFSREAGENLVAERTRNGPYLSLQDLRTRVSELKKPELENLIRCGALDGLGLNRAQLLWSLSLPRGTDTLRNNGVCPQGEGKVEGGEGGFQVADWPPDLKARAECEVLGFSALGHPLTFYREAILEALRKRGVRKVVAASNQASEVGRKIWAVGWWVTAKRTFTQTDGQAMMFSTFSDKTGRFETVLFPDSFRRNAKTLTARSRGPYLVYGRVEQDLGVCQVNGERLELV